MSWSEGLWKEKEWVRSGRGQRQYFHCVCVCVWGGGWEERNSWSMTSRTVRAKWAWPPSRVFHTEHKNALMSSFYGLPLTSLCWRRWRAAAFLSCIVIQSRWGRPHLSPAVFPCTIKASHRGAKCADRSPSVSFVVIELLLVLCWLLRHFILMIAGNGAASVNYASASMNCSNTAAKDFQEQTRFVLLMAKQNKQTKKKEEIPKDNVHWCRRPLLSCSGSWKEEIRKL